MFSDEFRETCHPAVFASFATMEESHELTTEPMEIFKGKILHIGTGLIAEQKQQLMSMVREKTGAFAWDYLDMRGIHPDTCIHHIYMNEEMGPIWKP